MINWFINASHQVHEDCKGHTEGAMTLEKRAVRSVLRRQKINIKYSTETKIIGTDNILPQALWTKYFIEIQGYILDHKHPTPRQQTMHAATY